MNNETYEMYTPSKGEAKPYEKYEHIRRSHII